MEVQAVVGTTSVPRSPQLPRYRALDAQAVTELGRYYDGSLGAIFYPSKSLPFLYK